MSDKRKAAGKPKSRNFKRAKYGGGGPSKLEVGMRGVLISHDRNREKSCRIDSFTLLNYFADELYGPEPSLAPDQEEDSGPDDIETALASEVNSMKSKSMNDTHRRFQTVKSGCNNLIFIKCKGLMPGALVRNIVDRISSCEDLSTSGIPQTRNILRVHPVELTCPGYLEDIAKIVPPYLEEEFDKFNRENAENEAKEYTIEYKCRNNSHLSRHEVLETLYEQMKDSKSGWKYNCRSKNVSVLIDVLKTICLVSIVKNYQANRKYNIREIFLAKTLSSYKTATGPERGDVLGENGAKLKATEEKISESEICDKICDTERQYPDKDVDIKEAERKEPNAKVSTEEAETQSLDQNQVHSKIDKSDGDKKEHIEKSGEAFDMKSEIELNQKNLTDENVETDITTEKMP